MKAAITTLEVALQTLETNAPINRAEGNAALAIVQEQDAAETRQAIAILKAVDTGPLWSQDKTDSTTSFIGSGWRTLDECQAINPP